jgi:hypothetical protein
MRKRRQKGTWRGMDASDFDLRAKDNRCTEEKLEAYLRARIAETGRFPTLYEIKKQFGGILGAFVCAWALDRRGVLAELKNLCRR